jgi:hypothetical protein
VADLKTRVLFLEKENKGLVAAMRRYQAEYPETLPEETKKSPANIERYSQSPGQVASYPG